MKWINDVRAAWYCGRGFSAFEKGKFEGAIAALERAAALNSEPLGFIVLNILGRSYAAVGKLADAITTLEAARVDCAHHQTNRTSRKHFEEATIALVGVLSRIGEGHRASDLERDLQRFADSLPKDGPNRSLHPTAPEAGLQGRRGG